MLIPLTDPHLQLEFNSEPLWINSSNTKILVHESVNGPSLLNGKEEEKDPTFVAVKKKKKETCKKTEEDIMIHDLIKGHSLFNGKNEEQDLPYIAAKKTKKEKETNKEREEDGKARNGRYGKKTREIAARHYVALLKTCSKQKDLTRGCRIHAEISRRGLLQMNVFIGSTLVNMYAKFGLLAEAQAVFDSFPARDVVLWNALIAGYAEHGNGRKALDCFEQMKLEGFLPDMVTFIVALKACANLGAIKKGQEIHDEILRKGLFENDIAIGNALINMYAKWGMLDKAKEVFDELPVHDVVSWNVLIGGYTEHGHGEEAMKCFHKMQLEGCCMDAVTFVSSLKACAIIGAIDKGQEIHAEVSKRGLLERNHIVATALVSMYAKCGLLTKAQEVFNKLPVQGRGLWNALIAGYTDHGCGDEALNCFEQMRVSGVSADVVTFLCSLKACASTGSLKKGKEIHIEISNRGLLERYVALGNALINMYAKCGSLATAQKIFDELPVRDVASWNVLIEAYAKQGCGSKALKYFDAMKLEGLSPNAVSFICSLTACASIQAIDKGQQIHAEILESGLLEKDTVVASALVNMYAKCSFLTKAQKVFDRLPVRDVVSWNALIAGYVEQGRYDEALNCFKRMQLEVSPLDSVAYVCSLKACASTGAIDTGREIHVDIEKRGLLEKDIVIGNALINMYAKCGLLSQAREVFDKLPVRDVVSWTALITGYAQCKEAGNTFYAFDRMIKEGVKPIQITFISVLIACSHLGLVDKGQMYFESMEQKYGIAPTFEHYICMVDLLSRAGQLGKVIDLIEKMPFKADLVMWHIVLSACRKWCNVKLGRQAFEHAVQLDEKNPAAYICMSNIYADAGMQEDVNNIEMMRLENQALKEQGQCWWSDTGEVVHIVWDVKS